MSRAQDSVYSKQSKAFDVYCKHCKAHIMGPGKFPHSFVNKQNQRFAQKPGGQCYKCKNWYDITDNSSFLRETEETALVKKQEQAAQDARDKVAKDADDQKQAVVDAAANALKAKQDDAEREALEKVKDDIDAPDSPAAPEGL